MKFSKYNDRSVDKHTLFDVVGDMVGATLYDNALDTLCVIARLGVQRQTKVFG